MMMPSWCTPAASGIARQDVLASTRVRSQPSHSMSLRVYQRIIFPRHRHYHHQAGDVDAKEQHEDTRARLHTVLSCENLSAAASSECCQRLIDSFQRDHKNPTVSPDYTQLALVLQLPHCCAPWCVRIPTSETRLYQQRLLFCLPAAVASVSAPGTKAGKACSIALQAEARTEKTAMQKVICVSCAPAVYICAQSASTACSIWHASAFPLHE